MNTLDKIRAKLASLEPTALELTDDSAKHAGHAGAASGGGHFQLFIVSEQFAGLGLLARHRLIYDALGPMMRQDIHALAIVAKTQTELTH